MKKVVIISTSYFPNIWNGLGRSTFSTALGLAKNGMDVDVYTFTTSCESFVKQDGQVQVFYEYVNACKTQALASIPAASLEEWNRRVYGKLSQKKYDIVILITSAGWSAVKMYRQKNKDFKLISFVPYLYNITGWLKPLEPALENFIKQKEIDSLLASDIVITYTGKFGEKVARYIDKEVYVIPNCYLPYDDKFSTGKGAKLQLCFIGRANREKNLERIVRVLPDLPYVNLVVVSPKSSDKYLANLKFLAKRLDVDHKISYIGWKSTMDAKKIYQESALAVVPSQFEPYGYNCLDPMSFGVPVLVSEWSCLDEYLGDKRCVFHSLQTLQEKILEILILSEESKQKMLDTNKQVLEEKFSEIVVTNLLLSLL